MELRECPFCGSQHIGFDFVETYSTDSSYGIFGCRECGFHINTSDDRGESAEEISAWNRRASPASVPEGYALVPVEPTEDRKDAERYRWLRSSSTGPSQIWELLSDDCQPPILTLKCMGDLDAAIDKAMQEDKP